jgi:hypothetical protein
MRRPSSGFLVALRSARLLIAVAVGYVAGWLASHLLNAPYGLSLLVGVLIAVALLMIISRTLYAPLSRDEDNR